MEQSQQSPSLRADAPVFTPSSPGPAPSGGAHQQSQSAGPPSLPRRYSSSSAGRSFTAGAGRANRNSFTAGSGSGPGGKKLQRGQTFGNGPPRNFVTTGPPTGPLKEKRDGGNGNTIVSASGGFHGKMSPQEAYRLRQAKASKAFVAKRKQAEKDRDNAQSSREDCKGSPGKTSSPPATPDSRSLSGKTGVEGADSREFSPSSMSIVSAPSSAPESPEQAQSNASSDKAGHAQREHEDTCRALEGDSRRLSDERGSHEVVRASSESESTSGSCHLDEKGVCIHVKAAAAANRAASAALEAASAAAAAAAVERKDSEKEARLDSGKWCQECAGLGLHLSALVTQLQAGKPSDTMAAEVAAEERKEKEKEKEKEKSKSSWKRTVSAAMINAGVTSSSGSSSNSTELAKFKVDNRRLEDENQVLRAAVEYLHKKLDVALKEKRGEETTEIEKKVIV